MFCGFFVSPHQSDFLKLPLREVVACVIKEKHVINRMGM